MVDSTVPVMGFSVTGSNRTTKLKPDLILSPDIYIIIPIFGEAWQVIVPTHSFTAVWLRRGWGSTVTSWTSRAGRSPRRLGLRSSLWFGSRARCHCSTAPSTLHPRPWTQMGFLRRTAPDGMSERIQTCERLSVCEKTISVFEVITQHYISKRSTSHVHDWLKTTEPHDIACANELLIAIYTVKLINFNLNSQLQLPQTKIKNVVCYSIARLNQQACSESRPGPRCVKVILDGSSARQSAETIMTHQGSIHIIAI